jgi:hypothetical protein
MRASIHLLVAGSLLVPALSFAQTPESVSRSTDPAVCASRSLAASSPVLSDPVSSLEMMNDGPMIEADPPGGPAEAPANRWFVRGEYLIWWLREGRVPPLLTTSPVSSGGVLGAPDTLVIYGDDRLETRHGDRFVGGRITAGYWLNCEESLGLEGTATFLERDSTYFKAVSTGDTLLARPFYSALDGSAQSEIIAGPTSAGVRNGGFVGYSRIEVFDEEANLLVLLATRGRFCCDLLAGAHFLQMRDRLDLTATGRLIPNETILFGETDHYRVDNRFYGGQAGLRGQYSIGPWFFNLRGTVALGGTEQIVRTFGDHLIQSPTSREVEPFGLYILPSNSGRFVCTVFDTVYDVGVNAGCQLTRHIRILTGYTLLLWSNPIRAGDQVDLVINPTQLTGSLSGPARPSIPFRSDFFWAQGMNVSLEICW